MKRAGKLIGPITDSDNLRLAWTKAIRGKRSAASVLTYRENLDRNLRQLSESLASGTYSWGPYFSFKIHDPKERVIKVAPLADRIAHHAICHVCEPFFERFQIYDSYACRKGKGQLAALHRAVHFSSKYGWYLKLDVRKYFDSISHEILVRQLERLFKDPILLKLFRDLVDSYTSIPGRGIPIGSLTSQFLANHYLSSLDHFIKETLCVRGYVRYMDDMVLWFSDSEELKRACTQVDTFLREKLYLEMKPPQQNRSRVGLPFLGLRVYPYGLRLSHRSRYRFRRKCRKNFLKFYEGTLTQEEFVSKMESLFAFVRTTPSVEFRRRVLRENGFCA